MEKKFTRKLFEKESFGLSKRLVLIKSREMPSKRQRVMSMPLKRERFGYGKTENSNHRRV